MSGENSEPKYANLLCFVVTVQTNKLMSRRGGIGYSTSQVDTHTLIKSLSDMHWETKRISDYLNSNNFKKFYGFKWIPKLVYMNRQKYLKRLKRLEDYKIINVKENLVIRSIKILRI